MWGHITRPLHHLSSIVLLPAPSQPVLRTNFQFSLVRPFFFFHMQFPEVRESDSWLRILHTPASSRLNLLSGFHHLHFPPLFVFLFTFSSHLLFTFIQPLPLPHSSSVLGSSPAGLLIVVTCVRCPIFTSRSW